MFKSLKNKFTKVEFHIEEVTRWNGVYDGANEPSFTNLIPFKKYEIVMEITRFFFFKERIQFEDTFFCRYIKPPIFKTEEQAREVVENLILKGKYPGKLSTRIIPPSYTFKNIEDNV